ncbi:MAG: helix-turn-helix domain-containing protein [Bacteriovoracia bacterium]
MAKIREIRKCIARSIRDIRIRTNLSQTELGDLLLLRQESISRIEKGNQSLSAERLYLLSVKLKVPLDKFFIF